MKKLLLFLLIPFLVGAAPSRVATYTAGTTILSSAVTSNEDAIFTYLQNGIDTIADGSVVNADISSAASIAENKLNLASIAQSISMSGTLTHTGSASFSTITDLGTVADGEFTLIDINGGTIDGATLGASSAVTITSADINGGSLDNVNIGTTTATGELIVNNSSDYADGLGSQGTSGQVLTSAGTGANPTWTTIIAAATAGDVGANTDGSISTFTCDTEREKTSASESYTKFKEIVAPKSGTLRIKFTLRSPGGAAARIYRSGVAVGTEQTLNNNTTEFSEDIAGWTRGDLIQVYAKTTSGTATVAISNFRIYEATPTEFYKVTYDQVP